MTNPVLLSLIMFFLLFFYYRKGTKGLQSGGGPLQMLLTPTLNLLLACPKNLAAGPTFGPYRKIRKVNHLYRKFGPFKNFFAKNFLKNLTSGLKKKHYLLAL
jgi:hypothetical protein